MIDAWISGKLDGDEPSNPWSEPVPEREDRTALHGYVTSNQWEKAAKYVSERSAVEIVDVDETPLKSPGAGAGAVKASSSSSPVKGGAAGEKDVVDLSGGSPKGKGIAPMFQKKAGGKGGGKR